MIVENMRHFIKFDRFYTFSSSLIFDITNLILMDIFRFLTFGTPKYFTSTRKVNMSIKYPSVCVAFKQAASWQHYNHLCVFLVVLCNINMWKPWVPVNLFDLWPLCVSQTTNKCSWVGGLKAGSHRSWWTQNEWVKTDLFFATDELRRHFSGFFTLSVTINGHTHNAD